MDRDEEEKALVQDFKETFASPHGLRVLKHMAKIWRATESTFVDQNPTGTAYREGLRGAYIYIVKQISKDLGKKKQRTAKNG